MRLISGKMNVPYIVCKPGYAIGVDKPRRVIKPKPFNPLIKLRKAEFKDAA